VISASTNRVARPFGADGSADLGEDFKEGLKVAG